MSNKINISAIDLFCGIGGLSYGLKQAGIPVIAGLDLDSSCEYAFEENVKSEFFAMDVTKLTGDFVFEKLWIDKDSTRVLVGCAPCQPFSTHSNKIKDKQASSKWHLLDQFKRLIEETTPHIVSMENVPNLANQQVFKEFVEFLEDNNYFVSFSNVYCPDYGIPQKRRRLVLLASLYGEIDLIPKTHTEENYVSLRDAIAHLPAVDAGQVCETDALHRTRQLSSLNLRRIKNSRPNGTWLDWDDELKLECHKKDSGNTYTAVYGRMAWNEPSSTITTQFHSYGTGRFGHPVQDRALTIREGALLQTFPEDYKFVEDEKEISITKLGIHIGNAVPVKLGFIIGQSIQKHLEVHNGAK